MSYVEQLPPIVEIHKSNSREQKGFSLPGAMLSGTIWLPNQIQANVFTEQDSELDKHIIDQVEFGTVQYRWPRLGNVCTIEGVTCLSGEIDFGDYTIKEGSLTVSDQPGFGMKLLI